MSFLLASLTLVNNSEQFNCLTQIVSLIDWQVDLLEQKWVSGVLTQGYTDESGINLWVTKYQVSYSTVDTGALTVLSNASGVSVVSRVMF